MSAIGSILMWAFLIVAFVIIAKWPMGKESDRRTTYWERFERK
jgi:hypothetical protein